MFSRLMKWIDERWPLTALVRLSLDEEMAGGTATPTFLAVQH